MSDCNFVGSRLNPKRDMDIIEALKNADTVNASKLVRKGLRTVLGLNKSGAKQAVKQVEQSKKPPQKAAVWNFPK